MKILVIFTGGTIGSTVSGKNIKPDSGAQYTLLDNYERKYGNNTDFSSVSLYRILSENLTYTLIFKLNDYIKSQNTSVYNGIIITHGTDTLQYTAAALCYLLNGIKIPVVLVSSNYPLDDKRANGNDNFAAAVSFIESSPKPMVYVSYKNEGENVKLHLGTRVLPHRIMSDRLESVFDSFAAEIDREKVVPNPEFNIKPDEFSPVEINPETHLPKVLCVNAYVGMGNMLPKADKSETDCVMLTAYHSGTLPTADPRFADWCRNTISQDIPLYILGTYMENEYESALEFRNLGITRLPAASPVAMQVKYTLLHLSGQTAYIAKRLAGDFIE